MSMVGYHWTCPLEPSSTTGTLSFSNNTTYIIKCYNVLFLRMSLLSTSCSRTVSLIIIVLVMCLSTNGERAKDYTIKILTSNTEATENKVQFLNLAYRVKGFQCHSNNSLQLLGRKKKTKKKTIHVI